MTAQNIIKLYTEAPKEKANTMHYCVGVDYTKLHTEEIKTFASILDKTVHS